MKEYEPLWRELGLDVRIHSQVLESIETNFERMILSQKNRPRAMAYFDDVIRGAHGQRVAEIIERRKAGGRLIGTFCIYVPEEIVLALGAVPVALCGGTAVPIPYAEKTFPRNICPLVKSTLGLSFSHACAYAPIKDLAVGETTCDAKKKTWDILAQKSNFHVMEVPQKKAPADKSLWMSEIMSLADRLEGLTGRQLDFENLRGAVRLMNRKRRALAELHSYRKWVPPPVSGRDFLVVMQGAMIDDTQRFTERVEELNAELKDRLGPGAYATPPAARRILIAGCPSVLGNWKVHYLVESAGAVVVGDETCTGTRYFEGLVDERGESVADLLEAIAARYMGIHCSCFSPNDERIEDIRRLAAEHHADGVIQLILLFCHGYNIEAIRVASSLRKAGVPSLKIETDYSEEDTGQLRTRIEAFLEGLESAGSRH